MQLAIWGGCAPREYGPAVRYFADREHVRDAAARSTSAAWYLRFDAELIHDLDSASADPEEKSSRELGRATIRRAGELACRSAAAELARLSPNARTELARRAACDDAETELAAAFEDNARGALQGEIDRDEKMALEGWRRRLREIRDGIEPLADDRDRAARQILLAGLAPAVSIGIEQQERRIRSELRERSPRSVERAAIWEPAVREGDPLHRWSPILAVEWPVTRDYPADYDRIGAVTLAGTRQKIAVSIDPRRPTLYAYTSTAVIHGRRYSQLCYVWWFSDRPAMTTDDAIAGHIDGGTLRLTLDRQQRPAIAEVILNCGCGHEVYVAADVEAAARREFGPALPDAEFAIESRSPAKRPILVAGIFDRTRENGRPVLHLQCGTHEPRRFAFAKAAVLAEGGGATAAIVGDAVETQRYELSDYDALDRLPLGDGVASMFGADGLVHDAGRREGYLLAPSGMMSAGQPRKRGTQRIRWDAYLFDEPALLERVLRVPSDF